jgi:hypothetical protein
MEKTQKDIDMAKGESHVDRIRSGSRQHVDDERIGHTLSRPQDHSKSENNTIHDLEKEETALSWIQTHESQYTHTVGPRQTSRESTLPLPFMGAGKPYPPDLPGQTEYLVEFDGADDANHPQNWSTSAKLVPAKSSSGFIF